MEILVRWNCNSLFFYSGATQNRKTLPGLEQPNDQGEARSAAELPPPPCSALLSGCNVS
jgi:hypothetical protein